MRAEQRREYACHAFEGGHTIKRIADDLGLSDETAERLVSGRDSREGDLDKCCDAATESFGVELRA